MTKSANKFFGVLFPFPHFCQKTFPLPPKKIRVPLGLFLAPSLIIWGRSQKKVHMHGTFDRACVPLYPIFWSPISTPHSWGYSYPPLFDYLSLPPFLLLSYIYTHPTSYFGALTTNTLLQKMSSIIYYLNYFHF